MKVGKIVVLLWVVIFGLTGYVWAEPEEVVVRPGNSNEFVDDYDGMSMVPISVGVYVGGYGDGKIESKSYGEIKGSPERIGNRGTRFVAFVLRVDLTALEEVRDQIKGGQMVFRYKFASNQPTIELYEIDSESGDWDTESVNWKSMSREEEGLLPALNTGKQFGEMQVEGAGGKLREARFDIPASVLSEWANGNNPGMILKIKDWNGSVKIETVNASGGNTPALHVEGDWDLDDK